MPVFDYKCEKCNARYDVYHKVREVVEDVVCPACGSKSHKKLMSVPAAPITAESGSRCEDGACDSGGCGCGGGSCMMN